MDYEIGLNEKEPERRGCDARDRGVFVKGLTWLIVSDKLEVMPASTETSLYLLSKLEIKDGSTIEEFNIHITQQLVGPQDDHPVRNSSLSMHLYVLEQKKMKFYLNDLLFSFLTIPLGYLVKEMSGSTSKGCINHLYNSAEEALYQKSYEHKDMLLTPGLARSGIFDVNAMKPKSDYHEHTRGGFVMESAMFNITDNLIITPISPVSCLSFLKELNVPFDDIEERVVHVGDEEVLRLLVASFVSESALTDAFLRDPNLNPES
ncbi:hypothetical protein JRO89_XS13G0109500 [Xanthoceras sorbifolium]|uniref:Uncharacterized protein n=1 Tax=Xanthoceras sorbifolium TaxID=99658 RepID=A0ABQ8H7Q2_9ROSI|nr:hypothetical protein JRO89_XS13G0109500 [Xanthoceras sorbifolium]